MAVIRKSPLLFYVLATCIVLLLVAIFMRTKRTAYSPKMFAIKEEAALPTDLKIVIANEKRRRRVAEVCRQFPHGNKTLGLVNHLDWDAILKNEFKGEETPLWLGWHMHIIDKFDVLYCHTPKVACTNTLQYLIKLSEPSLKDGYIERLHIHTNYSQMLHIKMLNQHPFDEAMNAVTSYKSFAFVRNPLERAISAWKDKLTRKTNFSLNFGKRIIRQYRPGATEEEIEKGFPITLKEFFEYIADSEMTWTNFNPHWMPMYMACAHCAVQYDFIGRLDNINEEMSYLARSMTGNATVPLIKAPSSKNVFNDKWAEVRKLPRQLVERVQSRYELDYKMFGYDMKADLDAIYAEEIIYYHNNN